jgi:glycosyltransferase involved in cell wall biosynthesis
MEIILVDDGSTDNSGKMCDEYALNDKRIKVIHKSNGGLSEARNYGLDIAKGEYIAFVDGDDYVSNDYIEILYNNLIKNKADISIATFDFVYEDKINNKNRRVNKDVEIWNSETALKYMLLHRKISTMVPMVLSKKEYWENVRFPVGEIAEDVATSYKIYDQAEKIVFQDICVYYYLVREGSIQHSAFSIAKMDELAHALQCKEFIEMKYPMLVEASINKVVTSVFHIMFMMDNWKDNKEIFDKLRSIVFQYRVRMIFGKDVNKKVRFACASSYLGFGFTRWLYVKLGMRGKMNL